MSSVEWRVKGYDKFTIVRTFYGSAKFSENERTDRYFIGGKVTKWSNELKNGLSVLMMLRVF